MQFQFLILGFACFEYHGRMPIRRFCLVLQQLHSGTEKPIEYSAGYQHAAGQHQGADN